MYSIIFVFIFLAEALPPPVVYSAKIKNMTGHPVMVTAYYYDPQWMTLQPSRSIVLPPYPGRFLAKPKLYWDGIATHRKPISLIRVSTPGGHTLTLQEPFMGVYSPHDNWRFHIHDHGIESAGPSF